VVVCGVVFVVCLCVWPVSILRGVTIGRAVSLYTGVGSLSSARRLCAAIVAVDGPRWATQRSGGRCGGGSPHAGRRLPD